MRNVQYEDCAVIAGHYHASVNNDVECRSANITKQQCICSPGESDQLESHVKFRGSGALSAGGIVLPPESVSGMLTSLGARFRASCLIGPLAPP